MGDYVPNVANPPFEWNNSTSFSSGNLSSSLVERKYTETMDKAQQLLNLAIGAGGTGGLLGELNDAITTLVVPLIGDFSVAVPEISTVVETRPSPSLDNLDLDFPVFDKAPPTLATLPTVDTSTLIPGIAPDDVEALVNWFESSYDDTVFSLLLATLRGSLGSEYTSGINENVEEKIYERARYRMQTEELVAVQSVEMFHSTTGWTIPQGSKVAALNRLRSERINRNNDLNNTIIINQSELGQKNSHFALTLAKDLEAVLRDFDSKKNDRTLDKAKAAVSFAIAAAAENIKKFAITETAKRDYVTAQVEHLKGVTEYNNGLYEEYKAEVEANAVIIEGKAKRNEAVTNVYDAETRGYTAEVSAIAENEKAKLGRWGLLLQNATNQLQAAIARADASIKSYTAESSIRERLSADISQLIMQGVASLSGATHMSAGISHSTGVSNQESVTHGETRSIDYGKRESLSEDHSYTHPVT